MHTLEPILREHPFFKDLEPRFLELLVGCASNVVFKPDVILFREGEAANQFYIIREGQVSLEVYAPGRGPVVVQTLGEGEILGWSGLIPPYQRQFDARTLEKTRAIALDAKCLREKFDKDHDLGYELLTRFSRILVSRLQATRLQLLDIYGAVPS